MASVRPTTEFPFPFEGVHCQIAWQQCRDRRRGLGTDQVFEEVVELGPRLGRALLETALDELKNAHWILRDRRVDLNADERRLLNRLFAHSPKLKDAYEACEALAAIFDSRISKSQIKRKLRA